MGVMRDRRPAKRNIVFLQIAILVFVVGLILLIVGGVLIEESQRRVTLPPENGCKPSTEAERVGLFSFLKEVNEVYYRYRPYKVGSKPGVTEKEVREIYRAYDPTPLTLKQITDYSMDLLREINETKKIDEDELKPRERRMLSQVKLFLKYNLGSFYEGNFYNGDFMLGPNVFCASPVCEMGRDLKAVLRFLKPSTVGEVKYLENKLKEFNTSIDQYISNLRRGVETGFVRSMKACKAGLETIRSVYPKISLEGETGILNETFAKDLLSDNFTSEISSSVDNEWKRESEVSVKESLRQFMVEYVGRSFVTLFRYLEKEHMIRCVPDKDYSGLAKLPVPFVYMNGTKTNQETTNGKLPGTDIRANGKQLYLDTLRFFTTYNETPDAIYDLGWDMLNKVYPQVIEIAKNVTNEKNNDTAKERFLNDLKRERWYFDVRNIPNDQSNEEAQRKCISMETAQQHCGKRLEAIKKWFTDATEVMALIEPKTTKLFHFAGKRATTPNCPVVMEIDFNPASGVQSYRPTDPLCTTPAGYRVPFWTKKPGPSWGEYGINSHEARPGHHTQVMGYFQNFADNCGTPLTQLLNGQVQYQAFVEGWALYSESPLILEDTDLYKTIPDAQYYRYGTLKWQLFRAIRLIVDTGLHYKGYSREWALQLLADRAWDMSDVAQKEITRYQSAFGQALAYMVGKQRIIALRNYAKEQLKEKFDIRDFHFFLLYQGGVPLDYLEDSIKRYVKCVLDKSHKGCDDVLDPLKHVKAGVNYRESSSSYEEESIFYA